MSNIKFDYSKAEKFLAKREVEAMQPFVDLAHDLLHEGRSLGNDYIGWRLQTRLSLIQRYW